PSEVPGYRQKMSANTNVANGNMTGLKRPTPKATPTRIKKSRANTTIRDTDSEEGDTQTFEVTSAVNDIGMITLPDGRHIILAVYINDSVSDGSTREHVIADIAKAVCERWTTGVLPDPT